ncbi:MAG TPA: heme ABC transporter ATP-binding protein, partial [Lachnospiraceae bacterium]|nr:heme ABC transporter ATP-binding protein [Lachnospiraceae bacterium]
ILELSQKYGLDADLDQPITELAVGAQQRVEILKALYRGCDVLVLDEPTAALTDQEAEGLFEIMHKLTGEGKSVIFISHKMREVLRISDRVTILRAGQTVETVNIGDVTGEELANKMIGRELKPSQYEKMDSDGEAVAVLDHVSYHKSSKHNGLNDVSLTVHRGEVVGIAGVDGNGQSQLAMLLTGNIAPEEGSMNLKGSKVARFDPNGFIQENVSHIPEDRNKAGLVGNMSVS